MRGHFAGLVVRIGMWASVAVAGALLISGSATAQVPKGSKSITSQAVVTMVKLGMPDEAIIAAINVGPVNFDTSPNGLIGLRAQGVSGTIIEAMIGAERKAGVAGSGGGGQPGMLGSSGRGNPFGGNSRPGVPSQKLTPRQMNAVLAKLQGGKSGPVVTNPGAGQNDVSTLGILAQQKRTALSERSQTPASPAGTPSTNPVGTATITRVPGAIRGPITTAAAPPRSSIANRAATEIGQPNINVACGTFQTAMITAVSGQQTSTAVFTQDPQYNPFTIRGCNFGNTKGQAQLNFSNGSKLADLTIDTWTDTLITVEVDPTLTDVLDQSNVTLVLFPANGPQATKSGFRFFAMRRELLLSAIPASAATLAPINDDAGNPVAPEYSSPYKDQWTNQNMGTSAGVDRMNSVRFPGGTDTFDFSGLKPGFVLEKYQVKELSAAGTSGQCGIIIEQETDYTDGTWGWQMTGNTIRVSWQEAHAHIECEDESDASYGLSVWVVGPALSPNTSPWQGGVK
jgi:hypothetical protein